jgi:phosphoglycolate phosphatase
MTTPAPRAILFDWDNTLVDSWETIHHALVITLDAMGHPPWSLAETKARVRHSLRDAFPALFGERWDEARKLYLDTFTSIHLERLSPLAGAVDLLTSLRAQGLYVGVVSNKTGAILRREVAHLGWEPHFARLVGAGDAAEDKPAAAPSGVAARSGTSAIPASTWNVPPMPVASGSWSVRRKPMKG